MLMALPPLIVLPISYFLYKEKIGWQAILGTALAIAGVALWYSQSRLTKSSFAHGRFARGHHGLLHKKTERCEASVHSAPSVYRMSQIWFLRKPWESHSCSLLNRIR